MSTIIPEGVKICYLYVYNRSLSVDFYNHLRDEFKNSRLPVVTCAIDTICNRIGFSVNNPNENFCRKIGREYALNRLAELNDSPNYTIIGPDSIPSYSSFTSGLVDNVYDFLYDNQMITDM